MRVEHLKQLDIRSDERHQIALVSSFELRRGKAAKRREHLVANKRQQLEGDVVVADLLAVMKRATQKRCDGYACRKRLPIFIQS